MNTNVFDQLSEEHEALLPLIIAIQVAAEMRDTPAVLKELISGRVALTTQLDAHIALEEDNAFVTIAEAVGKELVAPFRSEHSELQALRDEVLARADAGDVSLSLCLRLCDLIQSHMQREDMMLFPSALHAMHHTER